MENYKIDFINNHMIISKAFSNEAQNLDSEEAILLTKILSDFPKMTVISRTHSTPSHYHNSNGTLTAKNQFKGLSYEKMERFINAISNSEELMKPYTFLKESCSYTATAKWFLAQFPYYRSNPLFYYNSRVVVIDASDFMSQQEYDEYIGEIA